MNPSELHLDTLHLAELHGTLNLAIGTLSSEMADCLASSHSCTGIKKCQCQYQSNARIRGNPVQYPRYRTEMKYIGLRMPAISVSKRMPSYVFCSSFEGECLWVGYCKYKFIRFETLEFQNWVVYLIKKILQ
jgi:hypothetical protein